MPDWNHVVGRHFEGMFLCHRHVNFGNRISACILGKMVLRNSFERELFVSGLASLVFTSFAAPLRLPVRFNHHHIGLLLHYFVREGVPFYTEMTGSHKTDQTQRACMLDHAAKHPSVYALPDEFSSFFLQALSFLGQASHTVWSGTSLRWLIANTVG